MSDFSHPESFCLMLYASKDRKTWEWLWNSRDGVTPYMITSRDGVEMSHMPPWEIFDHRSRFHVPEIGERVFVDDTPEDLYRSIREVQVERDWEFEIKGCGTMKERAVEEFGEAPDKELKDQYAKVLADSGWSEGAPRIVVVDEKLRAEFMARRDGGGE